MENVENGKGKQGNEKCKRKRTEALETMENFGHCVEQLYFLEERRGTLHSAILLLILDNR